MSFILREADCMNVQIEGCGAAWPEEGVSGLAQAAAARQEGIIQPSCTHRNMCLLQKTRCTGSRGVPLLLLRLGCC